MGAGQHEICRISKKEWERQGAEREYGKHRNRCIIRTVGVRGRMATTTKSIDQRTEELRWDPDGCWSGDKFINENELNKQTNKKKILDKATHGVT